MTTVGLPTTTATLSVNLSDQPWAGLTGDAPPAPAPRRWVRTRTTRFGTVVLLILPSLCRQPPRIRANNGELSRMRIRRWRACTNKCEPSRTGLQSPCKRAVVSSILTGGSTTNRSLPAHTFSTGWRKDVRRWLGVTTVSQPSAKWPQPSSAHRSRRARRSAW